MNKIKIETEIEVTDQDIDDIVCTAFEGGINYWCGKVEPVGDLIVEYAHEQIAKDGYLYLYDIEDDEEKWILTKSRLLNGIRMYIHNSTTKGYPSILYGKQIDTCEIDSCIADMIIQFALFEDIIYG